jgi:cysteine-rich secretory family protein
MRTANLGLLASALLLGFGCSSSSDEPGQVPAGGGSGEQGGSLTNASGAVTPPGGSSGNGGATQPSAGAGHGGLAGGASATGGANGGSSGSLSSNGGSSVGAGVGGRATGGGGSANGGGGGTGACVKNLACKLSPPPSTGDIYQDCVDRINQFLTQCACLPALTRRTDGEACADQMAEYDAAQNSAHAGAIAKICQPGGSQNECPGYSSNSQVIGLCMQQMWDEGPPPTSSCTGDCYEEHGHFINMTDPDVTKVACGFYTTASGKVWAAQNFSR